MTIEIYTYQNPYKLDQEDIWNEIGNCPYFCVSQTTVNGLKEVYGLDFVLGRVTTVNSMVNTLFLKWNSSFMNIKQHADIDNILNYGFVSSFDEKHHSNLAAAFKFNRDDVFKSIRTLFELNINPNTKKNKMFNNEQVFIMELYKTIKESSYSSDFCLNNGFTEQDINLSILECLKNAYNNSYVKESDREKANNKLLELDTSTIVIQGVHQFTPIILRMIDEISKYKRVILLFNYQEKFKQVYKTWIDIYELFDKKIHISNNNGLNKQSSSLSNESNNLANDLGKLVNGKQNEIIENTEYKTVLVFNNMTEFAGYIARIYDNAKTSSEKNNRSPLANLKEQFYSADSSVNEILKMYFPERFGERQFLNYPLGHFFLGIANMWENSKNQNMQDISDIKECFSARIIDEPNQGDLLNILGKCESLFTNCRNIDEILYRIKNLIKKRKRLRNMDVYASHISYYNCSLEEIDILEKGLEELSEISKDFFEEFDKKSSDFGTFYKKMKSFIEKKTENNDELEDEFRDIVKRVIIRLDNVKDIKAKASFDCLKSTMKIYLQQEQNDDQSAKWIVRNFEQLDGDILRTKKRNDVIYHFGCLTDEDINSNKRRDFPWPLDADFFELAQDPIDWKYLVYVKSAQEYKNFKRYALIFGLQYNCGDYRLSYIKKKDERDRELYYLLKILGLKEENYLCYRENIDLKDTSLIQFSKKENVDFEKYDYYKYKICPYKFLLESIAEGNTIYKDDFLILKYMEVVLENTVKQSYEGLPISPINIIYQLEESYERIKMLFPFEKEINRMDVINNVKNRLLKNKWKKYPILNNKEIEYMRIRENFIYQIIIDNKNKRNLNSDLFKNMNIESIKKEMVNEVNQKRGFVQIRSSWCDYCSNRENCLINY